MFSFSHLSIHEIQFGGRAFGEHPPIPLGLGAIDVGHTLLQAPSERPNFRSIYATVVTPLIPNRPRCLPSSSAMHAVTDGDRQRLKASPKPRPRGEPLRCRAGEFAIRLLMEESERHSLATWGLDRGKKIGFGSVRHS